MQIYLIEEGMDKPAGPHIFTVTAHLKGAAAQMQFQTFFDVSRAPDEWIKVSQLKCLPAGKGYETLGTIIIHGGDPMPPWPYGWI